MGSGCSVSVGTQPVHPGSWWHSGEGQGEGWQQRDGLGRADKPPAHPHHLSPDVSAVLTSVPAPGALDVTAARDGSGEEPAEGVTHQTSHLLPHSPGSTLELHPQP